MRFEHVRAASVGAYSNVDAFDGGARNFDQTLLECRFQELQLRRPSRVVNLHYQGCAVEFHRLYVGGQCLADHLFPAAKYPAERSGRDIGGVVGTQRTNYSLQAFAEPHRFVATHGSHFGRNRAGAQVSSRDLDLSAMVDGYNRVGMGSIGQHASSRQHHLTCRQVFQQRRTPHGVEFAENIVEHEDR